MECREPGCKRMMLTRDYKAHILNAAQSHHTLQDAEIRLRRVINDKVTFHCTATSFNQFVLPCHYNKVCIHLARELVVGDSPQNIATEFNSLGCAIKNVWSDKFGDNVHHLNTFH